MKPTVLKLLSDRNLGGVNKTMEGLINSPLGEKFEFVAATVGDSKNALRSHQPDIVIFHDPCCWRNLPTLWAIAKICHLSDVAIADWGRRGREAVRSAGDTYIEAWGDLLEEIFAIKKSKSPQ